MKKIKEYIHQIRNSLNTKIFKVGSYHLSNLLIVIAILIVVNLLFSSLPSKYTQFDMSSAQLYTLTSQTKAIVNSLEEDVTIYWVVQSGEEDAIIEKLLERYNDLSEHVEVVKKDPDAYPMFMENYTSSTYYNNSLVIECNEKYRYIDYYDIYETTSSYYSTSTSFDGENCITSAIDYVSNDEFPFIYILNGHGEADLSSNMFDLLESANIDYEEVSLLNVSEISNQVDCILINGPESDYSDLEVEMIENYLDNGGNLIVLEGLSEKGNLDNLEKIINNYGIESVEGIVFEGSQDYYAFGDSFVLLPDMNYHEITNSLIEKNYYSIVPIAKGYVLPDESEAEISSLLSTSSYAYSKIDGYEIETYDKEENDIDGPFTIAFSIREELEEDTSSIVWFGSSYVLDETYDSYSSYTNSELILNAINWTIGEESKSIQSKSLDYSYLVIDSTTANYLQALFVGVIPFVYLSTGIVVVVKRRSKS